MPLCQCAGGRQNLFEIGKTFHHPSQHCHQLAALLDHIVGKHCLHLRGDVEQTIIKQHRRGFRNQCNLGKTVLNQCDLFGRHCNSPSSGFHGRSERYPTDMMIKLMDRGFAPVAIALSFVAGNVASR